MLLVEGDASVVPPPSSMRDIIGAAEGAPYKYIGLCDDGLVVVLLVEGGNAKGAAPGSPDRSGDDDDGGGGPAPPGSPPADNGGIGIEKELIDGGGSLLKGREATIPIPIPIPIR